MTMCVSPLRPASQKYHKLEAYEQQTFLQVLETMKVKIMAQMSSEGPFRGHGLRLFAEFSPGGRDELALWGRFH